MTALMAVLEGLAERFPGPLVLCASVAWGYLGAMLVTRRRRPLRRRTRGGGGPSSFVLARTIVAAHALVPALVIVRGPASTSDALAMTLVLGAAVTALATALFLGYRTLTMPLRRMGSRRRATRLARLADATGEGAPRRGAVTVAELRRRRARAAGRRAPDAKRWEDVPSGTARASGDPPRRTRSPGPASVARTALPAEIEE